MTQIQINLQPRLTSSVVTLAPLLAEDWSALYAVASDQLIWAGHPANDRWKEPIFRLFFEQALSSGGAFTVRDTATGAIVGSSRYSVERAKPNEVEIGWTFLARCLWGGPANVAMKRLMINHALHYFDRVIFIVGEDNGRSRRAMEKIGSSLTDWTFEALIGERSVRHVTYVIDRQLFAEGPLSTNRVDPL